MSLYIIFSLKLETNPTHNCQDWELNHNFIEMFLAGSQDNFPDHCVWPILV